MTQESMPFFDSAEEATKEAIRKSGKPMKDIGQKLWPEKSVEAAATALRNALNENRDERLTSDQHLLIANYVGHFDWLYYCCLKCSHAQPAYVTPEDQQTVLQREFVEAIRLADGFKKLLEQNSARLRAAA